MFYFTWKRPDGELLGLEQLVSQSRLALISGAFFLLLCVLLSLNGCEVGGSKLRYTLGRLSVGEKTIVFWWAIYNVVCFFLFWVVQLVIVLLLGRLYLAWTDAAYVSGQTIMLAFYRNNFLHSLLPLAETSRYIRNAMFVLGLGISAAYFSFRQRHGEKGIAIVILALLVVVYFSRAMGSFGSDLALSLTTLGIIGGAVGIWKERGLEDEF